MWQYAYIQAQGRQIQLCRLQAHILRNIWHNLREYEDKPPQVVHGNVPHIIPQEGHIVSTTGAGHKGHAEDRMVHATQVAPSVRTGQQAT